VRGQRGAKQSAGKAIGASGRVGIGGVAEGLRSGAKRCEGGAARHLLGFDDRLEDMPYALRLGCSTPGQVPFPITTRRMHIGSGERGNWTSIGEARAAINGPEGSSDFLVRQTAVDVTMGCAHDDPACLVGALKGFLGTIPFIPDDLGNQELFKPRLSLLIHQEGRHRISCYSIATLGAALAKAIALQPAFMVLAFENGPPIFTHIYAIARDVESDEGFYDLDSTNRFQRGSRAAPIARWRMIPI